MTLRAPFPWFGGKSRVAHLVWERFGVDVANYVEPFFGSGAVLLGRPGDPRIETVNDRDCYLSNFWRAVQADPEAVAAAADWPVSEADLHARHRWLVAQSDFRERMRSDPDYYDARIAGWWVWGISQWIGGGWCTHPEWEGRAGGFSAPRGVHRELEADRPDLARPRGVHRDLDRQRPSLDALSVHKTSLVKNRDHRDGSPRHGRPYLGQDMGVHRRSVEEDVETLRQPRPTLGKGGHGVHNTRGTKLLSAKRVRLGKGGTGVGRFAMFDPPEKLPLIGGTRGTGVHRRLSQQLPAISGDGGATGRGIHASALVHKMPKMDRGTESRLCGPRDALFAWFGALQARLRRVRVCCGDWKRILGPSPTIHVGVTAVFLDPPYSAEADRDSAIYGAEDLTVAHAVREWAIENGGHPKLRIALCGYEGEHDMPSSWSVMAWTSQGGYGAQARARGRRNRDRERIWFSPHCLKADQPSLFAEVAP